MGFSFLSKPSDSHLYVPCMRTAMWQAVGTRGSQSFVDLDGPDGVVDGQLEVLLRTGGRDNHNRILFESARTQPQQPSSHTMYIYIYNRCIMCVYIHKYLKTTFMCRLVVFPSFAVDSTPWGLLHRWRCGTMPKFFMSPEKRFTKNTGKTVGGIYSSIQ